MSAVLLPLTNRQIDWQAWEAHLERTFAAGLVPAINMDTGFASLLPEETRQQILDRTSQLAAGRDFVTGAFVADHDGDPFQLAIYQDQVAKILQAGGLPILFQSHGLCSQPEEKILESYQALAQDCPRFLAFELGTMFAPFGRIYSNQLFQELLKLPACIGLKHSSLSREVEWLRLQTKEAYRPDFLLLTGNDLAIDMVFYGSDYLLGLSTFAPDLFALRDHWWHAGDPRAISLNDTLQFLGHFVFRPPVPAYKHSAAMFLKLRGWLESDETFPGSPIRPASDRQLLSEIWNCLHPFVSEQNATG